MEKQKAAWLLYKEGLAQVDIAAVLGINRITVGRWAKDNAWEDKRDRISGLHETLEEGVLELIEYQQRVLLLKKTEWEADIQKVENGEMAAKDLRLIERGEIDALQKLYASIKGKPKVWSNYVEIMREFLNFLQEVDLNIAQGLTGHMQVFLNQKRGEL